MADYTELTDALVKGLSTLSSKQLAKLQKLADEQLEACRLVQPKVAKVQRFVEEYCIDFNRNRAAMEANMRGSPTAFLRDPEVAEAIVAKLKAHTEKSEMSAEYVRDYIMSVLELCPTDYFIPAPEGGWLITPEHFDSLPREVLRLIDEIEIRNVRGASYLAVRFLSKSAALAMAAKYTLTQHIEAKVATVPWEELTRELENQAAPVVTAFAAKVSA